MLSALVAPVLGSVFSNPNPNAACRTFCSLFFFFVGVGPRRLTAVLAMVRTHVYVVTPYCGGGDLLKMVVPGEGTGEPQARKWFRQVLLGLAYVHGKVRQTKQKSKQGKAWHGIAHASDTVCVYVCMYAAVRH